MTDLESLDRDPGDPPVISLTAVTKTYKGPVRALNDITVEVPAGSFTFLVGTSGSGKSTLLRLLTCEETATSGQITVAGNPLHTLKPWHIPVMRRNIGNVFQDYKLLPQRTVQENVAFALRVTGRKRNIKEQVPAILNLVGLTAKADRYPDELSGGEQQRVSIARAVVNRPLILLCDEPTGNLDPVTTDEIMDLLDRINQTGTTIIMATHDQTIVNRMRRRVIELDHGTIVRDETTASYQATSPT